MRSRATTRSCSSRARSAAPWQRKRSSLREVPPMFGDLDDLRHRYLVALESYLAGDGEVALEKAYEVGRALIAQGRGVVELADIHSAGTASVLAMSASQGSSSPSV